MSISVYSALESLIMISFDRLLCSYALILPLILNIVLTSGQLLNQGSINIHAKHHKETVANEISVSSNITDKFNKQINVTEENQYQLKANMTSHLSINSSIEGLKNFSRSNLKNSKEMDKSVFNNRTSKLSKLIEHEKHDTDLSLKEFQGSAIKSSELEKTSDVKSPEIFTFLSDYNKTNSKLSKQSVEHAIDSKNTNLSVTVKNNKLYQNCTREHLKNRQDHSILERQYKTLLASFNEDSNQLVITALDKIIKTPRMTCQHVSADVLWDRLEKASSGKIWRHRRAASYEELSRKRRSIFNNEYEIGNIQNITNDYDYENIVNSKQVLNENKNGDVESLSRKLSHVGASHGKSKTPQQNSPFFSHLQDESPQSSLILDDWKDDQKVSAREKRHHQDKKRNRKRHRPHKKPAENSEKRHESPPNTPDILSNSEALMHGSWQCHLEPLWKRMPEGIFPPYIETGRCSQKTCLMGLNNCVPRRYMIRVLQRVEETCNPLPLVGLNSSYEDVWNFIDYPIITGCDCKNRHRGSKA